jgi:two-component system CheB/CheR fusion protein
VLTIFAHALKPDGLLFLGKAEAMYANADLFAELDSGAHLYRSRGRVGWSGVSRIRHATPGSGPRMPAPGTPPKSFDLGRWLSNAHADGALAPLVVVDDNGQLVHVFGDVSPYLRLGVGLASLDVLQLAADEIRIELRSTLLHAQRQLNQRVAYSGAVRPAGGVAAEGRCGRWSA